MSQITQKTTKAIKLIVGLRNPGDAYSATRHNAGSWFVEKLIEQTNCILKKDSKLHSEIALFTINNVLGETITCRVALPLVYMNQSGLAVQAISQFYRIQPEEILIIHDELDLTPGRIKLKSGGGHGGHNGLRDIITHLGTNMFHRLRIGIGHPGQKDLVLDYVLGRPSRDDRTFIDNAIQRTLSITEKIILGKIEQAMNEVNNGI